MTVSVFTKGGGPTCLHCTPRGPIFKLNIVMAVNEYHFIPEMLNL